MAFTKIAYPMDQIHYIDQIRRQLDDLFFDVVPTTRPILNYKNLTEGVTFNNLKQVYEVEVDKVLRFDHTHVTKTQFSTRVCNQRNFGPVFRKEPRSSNRYREFFQYDVDYDYSDHDLRPLSVLMNYLGPEFEVKVNDVQIYRDLKESTLDEYSKTFHEKYPTLPKNWSLDSKFIRGWDYYQGFIFQIYHRNQNLAICGGGVYSLKNQLIFGFGFGVNRFINLVLKEPSLKYFLQEKKVIYIRYKESIPVNLLNALEQSKVKYHLKKARRSLFSDFKQDNQKLKKVNLIVAATLTVSNLEDELMRYSYKVKGMSKSYYDLDQLTLILKESCL